VTREAFGGARVGLCTAACMLGRANPAGATGAIGVGPELRLRKRAAHRRSIVTLRWGNPEQERRRTGDQEATETPLRVRDDRSQRVSGLRVGSKKSVGDVRFQQVPPVAAGGAHGSLA